MDERKVKIFQRAFEILNRREEQERQQRSADAGLVYKTFQNEQQPATMDAAIEVHVQRALKQFKKAITPAIGRALGTLRKELRDEFAAALAELRADMTIQTGIARGQIAETKRDVA